MLVENEQDWHRYRGMAPAFVKRIRERQQAQLADKLAERNARIEMLKQEAETARTAALKTKAEREAREAAERVAAKTYVKRRASTRFQRIVVKAAVIFDVTPAEIMGPCRNQRIVWARQFIMYWARRRTSMSYPLIGRLLGGRDHTTVMSGCRAYVDKRRAIRKRNLRPAP